ncbi:DUF5331 domain-containing protein [Pseudanabaena sp. FACHB-2040]|uniref:DUF5331 domain-containing protein n=1 Tax=Pseudanabaena sp. FACHB-2040 TaxID=2692859 RepID=UPI0016874940|nr:DUF5331 domain-containing protein [Pseudanabaena sp. FACHB-2040]MBD2260513.1 DUF5331 domain-containing protein [Pseudanabaena sp. FACHB-2040]
MAFFENFTAVIRQKWLDYVQSNRGWLTLQMQQTSVRTPDGGRRPSSFLVLGVINALEPKLSNLMVPFYQLNSDEDALVEVLGLNFDPEMALDNGGAPQTIDASDDTPLLPDVPGL